MYAIVFIILQSFFRKTRSFENWVEFPSFSWLMFGHVTRLDQSHESENI